MAKAATGPPTEYDAHDEGVIEAALDRAFQQYEGGDGYEEPGAGDDMGRGGGGGGLTPTNIRITARIEWAGVEQRSNNGVRSTRLEGLELGPVRDALARAREATQRVYETPPATSHRAQGWHAQLRELTESARGSAAADRAGLGPTSRTLMAWLSESREPNRANQERIREAYAELRNWNLNAARAEARQARHELAQRLSAAIADQYGSEVRLRDISRLTLED